MKKMKILALLLALVMLMSFATACGSKPADPVDSAPPSASKTEEPKVDYPTKSITLICAYAAGGSGDMVLRAIAEPLSEILGQPVVVSNVTGGAGVPAHLQGVTSKADGYTLLESASGPMAILPYTGETGYTYEDLQNIYGLAVIPNALAVHKDSPFQTLKEFLDYSKEHPGELTAGNSGAGGIHHVALEMVNKMYGTGVVSVPFDGASTGNAALLGQNIDAMCISSTDVAAFHASGDFRVLGVMADERIDILPGVPTFKEQGYDIVSNVWFGISAPKDTPQEIVDILEAALIEAGESESFKDACQKLNIMAAGYDSETFTAMIKDQVDSYTPILEDLGLAK